MRNNALFTSPVSTANAPNYAIDEGVGAQVGAGVNFRVDGTPPRVATMVILAGAVLAVLKVSGFRFNVGVAN